MHLNLIQYHLKKRIFILLAGIILAGFYSCQKESDQIKNPTVYIEKTEDGYRLIRNQKPFYIQGAAAGKEYLEELKEAGANSVRIYDTINLKNTLDKAHELGLAVAVDIPLPKFHEDPEFYEDDKLFIPLKQRVERIVKQFKDHPALLYWNLGNEIFYPYFYETTDFFDNYNTLINLIHDIDSNHPITTSTIGANKLRVLSIHRKSPDLDFISFNSFGIISQFSKKLSPISFIWNGPHVITEWGVNGPWEASVTSWKAPIEETSTKKAEQIRERYLKFIEPLKSDNSLGSYIFYWGKKNETTPTWFSLFGEDKVKSQAVHELTQIWKNKQEGYKGPEIEYILLNKAGAARNIILSSNSMVEATVVIPNKDQDLKYQWEIRKESWFLSHISEVMYSSPIVVEKNFTFKTPSEGGPYRLFLYAFNESEYYATANIPFYVLNPGDGE